MSQSPPDAAKPAAKTVVLVGHCGPDSSFLKMAVRGALPGATVGMADSDADLDAALSAEPAPDLLLFNRVMEPGFSSESGVEVMRTLKRKHPGLKVMLVSNYADAQKSAVEAGALPGFGKNDIGQDKAKSAIRDAVGG